jgi:hypothetical protein
LEAVMPNTKTIKAVQLRTENILVLPLGITAKVIRVRFSKTQVHLTTREFGETQVEHGYQVSIIDVRSA